jgi:MFS transporter, ACS family, D-galactonate transporter
MLWLLIKQVNQRSQSGHGARDSAWRWRGLRKKNSSQESCRAVEMNLLDISNQRRWTIVSLLFAASLINYLDRAVISFALPLISRDFRLTSETKGLLLSSFFWSYALMQLPIGWCADRFNLRWLYALAFTIWSFAQGLTGVASSLTMLLAFRILLGIGESIYLPGGTKIVSLLFAPKERGLPSGLFDFGTRTGLVLEGILVPWLLVHFGWRRTFVILGLTSLLWIAPWFSVFPRRLQTDGLNVAAAGHEWHSTFRTLLNRNLLGICLGFFCFDYYWYVLVTWLPDYLVTVRKLSIVQAGFYASLAFFTFGISEPIGGWIADSLIERGWDETATRKGIVTIAFSMGAFLIAAMRTAHTGIAIVLLMERPWSGWRQETCSRFFSRVHRMKQLESGREQKILQGTWRELLPLSPLDC